MSACPATVYPLLRCEYEAGHEGRHRSGMATWGPPDPPPPPVASLDERRAQKGGPALGGSDG